MTPESRAREISNADLKTARLTDILGGVARWIDQVWVDRWAPLHQNGPPQFLPTCFAVLAAECCGLLDRGPTHAARTSQTVSRHDNPNPMASSIRAPSEEKTCPATAQRTSACRRPTSRFTH
jgi:hypothetical protein